MLMIRTWGRRMVGADETKELWRPPIVYIFDFLFCHTMNASQQHLSSTFTYFFCLKLVEAEYLRQKMFLLLQLLPVRTDWAIYWTLGNFSKPLATNNLPKSPTFLGNFCKEVKIFNFSREIIFGQRLKTFGNFLLVTLLVAIIFFHPQKI